MRLRIGWCGQIMSGKASTDRNSFFTDRLALLPIDYAIRPRDFHAQIWSNDRRCLQESNPSAHLLCQHMLHLRSRQRKSMVNSIPWKFSTPLELYVRKTEEDDHLKTSFLSLPSRKSSRRWEICTWRMDKVSSLSIRSLLKQHSTIWTNSTNESCASKTPKPK